MKLGLATGVLSSTPPPAPTLWLLRIDRVWDRAEQPRLPEDELPDESYAALPEDDRGDVRWEVTVDGEHVALVRGEQRLRGRETSNAWSERRFEITEGAVAGGRFVMRGEDAEITLFGPGVPILSSERGKLTPR